MGKKNAYDIIYNDSGLPLKVLETPDLFHNYTTPHSKLFVSNCLLEAVKAKLRDWKNVKIVYIPHWLNPNRKHANHFLWLNKKLNFCYEFVSHKPINSHKLPITFIEGSIVVKTMDEYDEYMDKLLKVRYRQLSKRMGFNLRETEEKEDFEKKLDNFCFSSVENYVWRKFIPDLRYERFSEDDPEDDFIEFLVCFNENCHVTNSSNVAICKFDKNGIIIPESMKGKTPYWYMSIPDVSVNDKAKDYGVELPDYYK